MNQTTKYYLGLNNQSADAIRLQTANPTGFGRVQARLDELSEWRAAKCVGRKGLLLDTALGEAAMGLYLLASGIYRPAFASLRLFLELGFASVHFSAHRLELAEWLSSARDIKWSILSNPDSGILSDRFSSAFLPGSGPDAVAQLSPLSNSYRELSEYVHGNLWTVSELAEGLQFRQALAESWLKHFEVITDAMLCALCCRYFSELLKVERDVLAAHIGEHLTSCPQIRSMVGNYKG